MARKYNMTSRFGDLYDHITDYIVGFSIGYVAYTKYKSKLSFTIIAVIVIMTYLMQMHVGCQQIYHLKNKKDSKDTTDTTGETIDVLGELCHDSDNLAWSRFFAPAVYTLFVIGLMYYLDARKI